MDAKTDPATTDLDNVETQEWLDALAAVIAADGPERAHYLLERLIDATRRSGGHLPYKATTAYVNTIPAHLEIKSPGDHAIEVKLRAATRWNAMATVVRANRKPGEVGGHIASFQSAATLYDVGFNHFWRARTDSHPGDLLYIQGHCAPGIYARAYLEGRITAEQLDHYRMEVDGKGISSYPHPWLMPDFWQVPTVSMGLGPIMAIYQARFWKYLEARGYVPKSDRKVWCFMGDGESDEPESLGAISLAGREGLDNLVFVINCNLQRLDGPVRGNGKIIQELEGVFRGAGWNVLKVIWGAAWDGLLARDADGSLRKLMEDTLDGEYQNYKAFGGAYTRENFFGKIPKLKEMVASMSDDDIARLNRGGHDPHKVYAAYAAAMATDGFPTVILAKTVKGYGMGEAGESQNITHQQKKMDTASIRAFRDRFNVPIPDDQLEEVPYYHPGPDSQEVQYLKARREALGGPLPARRPATEGLPVPGIDVFAPLLAASGERENSSTMAFVRALNLVLRDKVIGPRVVPIVADEARTFGMEGLFRQIGIYAQFGQKYKPVDSDQLMYYREDQAGQVLQEGITEAGAMSSWIAAATSYATNAQPMLPFYIFYSMFGMQRIGDLAWAAGDMRARGFLLGATAGRTTLNGEGLQHEDGHSHLLAGAIPNCRAYDPTFACEVAVILQDGMKRMMTDQEDCFYYLTLMNENYQHPALPEGAADGIVRGIYKLKDGGSEFQPWAKIAPPAGRPGAGLAAGSTGTDGQHKSTAEALSIAVDDGKEPSVAAADPVQPAAAAEQPAPEQAPAAAPVARTGHRVQLLGSGTILREVIAAAELLEVDYGISADIWSVTSFTELARDGMDVERHNRLHPEAEAKHSYVHQQLAGSEGPIIAATDYVRIHADQIRAHLPAGRHYTVLGTDGFGRSDTRANLRRFFEVDRYYVATAALSALAAEGAIKPAVVADALKRYGVDVEKANPMGV